MMFSVLMRNTATTALSDIAIWIFSAIFTTMIADAVANALA